MDKDKLNEEMNKLMQNKKFVNCLIVLLVIIFLWLAVSNFMDLVKMIKAGKVSEIKSDNRPCTKA